MSRSRRHNPFCGITTCTSEKDDKRQAHQAHQAYRVHVRQAIQRMLRTGDETRPYHPGESIPTAGHGEKTGASASIRCVVPNSCANEPALRRHSQLSPQ